MTHTADDGTVRQDHYGLARQPWDDIVSVGWAPYFAAGNVLKYLRRTKDPEHSLESARWYWARLREMFNGDYPDASGVYFNLLMLLNPDEQKLLEG